MDKSARIVVAGHRGLVGSAIMRALDNSGHINLIKHIRTALDLTSDAAVATFFEQKKSEYVFLAATKLGRILASSHHLAEFIRDNLAIQTNLLHQAWKKNIKRLLYLVSFCIYPKKYSQPIKEEYLLTGLLEPSNRPYAGVRC
ncbi:MAG TPA: NAD-dependent epimerase/dehydratase family protein [Gammaproteobacteria bacterium]|nr:NAD-dependent epimerase/dehydratase family protein [Gammaproteobacteria bacterium]